SGHSDIRCQACHCTYNQGEDCTASSESVGCCGGQATSKSGTECRSFREKYERQTGLRLGLSLAWTQPFFLARAPQPRPQGRPVMCSLFLGRSGRPCGTPAAGKVFPWAGNCPNEKGRPESRPGKSLFSYRVRVALSFSTALDTAVPTTPQRASSMGAL